MSNDDQLIDIEICALFAKPALSQDSLDRLENICRGLDVPDAERETVDSAAPVRSKWKLRSVRYGAAALSVVAAVIGIRALLPHFLDRDRAGSSMAEELVDDHIRYLGVKEPTEVTTAIPEAAEEWFSSRLDVAVSIPRFSDSELRLLGGRLCYVLDRRVALLFYESHGRRCSLFVMSPAGLREDAPFPANSTSVEKSSEAYNGYRVVSWKIEGLMYALVCDARLEGIAEIVARAYRN